MLLDLSRLRRGVEHLERRYEPSQFPQQEDFRVVAPVEFDADLHKDVQKLRLVGHVKTTLEVDCSRCLDPFTVPIDSRFDVLLLPVSANQDEGEREVEADDLGVSFYEDDTLNLGDLIREQLYLALPMKPLCREDCQGLCPVCGANRNRETCTCRHEWIDPRLDALRALKRE